MPVTVHTCLHALAPSKIYRRLLHRGGEFRDLAVTSCAIDVADPDMTPMAEVGVRFYVGDLLPRQRLAFLQQLDELGLGGRLGIRTLVAGRTKHIWGKTRVSIGLCTSVALGTGHVGVLNVSVVVKCYRLLNISGS